MARQKTSSPSSEFTARSRNRFPRVAIGRSGIQKIAVAAAGVHLTLVALSGLQSTGLPESVQSLLGLTSPYLQSTHFGFDGTSLAMTTGGPADRAIELQFAEAVQTPDSEWTTAKFATNPGFAAADRVQRFLGAAVTLAENERPGLVARWLNPVVGESLDSKAIRLVHLPTLMTTVADDVEPIPYVAELIGGPAGVQWVHVDEPRLTALAVKSASEQSMPATDDEPIDSLFEAPQEAPQEAMP